MKSIKSLIGAVCLLNPSLNEFCEMTRLKSSGFESFFGYKELKITSKLVAGYTFRSLLIYHELCVRFHV